MAPLATAPSEPAVTCNSDAASALLTGDTWIQAVAEELGTSDCEFARRVLGAWLRMLRNRLTAEAAARFAAELPSTIRELFYENLDPNALPVKRDSKTYTIRFARAARIAVQDVSRTASAATMALCRQLSATEMDQALAELAPDVRTLITSRQVLREAC